MLTVKAVFSKLRCKYLKFSESHAVSQHTEVSFKTFLVLNRMSDITQSFIQPSL